MNQQHEFLVPKGELILPPGEDRALVLPPGVELAPEEEELSPPENVVVIGICHGRRRNAKGIEYPCGKRTQLWLPARFCHRCLMDVMAERMEQAMTEEADTDE